MNVSYIILQGCAASARRLAAFRKARTLGQSDRVKKRGDGAMSETILKASLRLAAGEVHAILECLQETIDENAIGLLAFEDPGGLSWTVELVGREVPTAAALESLAAAAGVTLRMLTIAPLPAVDWVKRSLEGLPPIRAGRFFVSGAHDAARAPPGARRLQIEAGQAFGTGSHPTTRGVLLLLDRLARARRLRRALDLGSGSGILTFALARLAPVPAQGVDIDPIAVATAQANARANALHPRVRFAVSDGLRHPAVRTGEPYDLILANILAGPLVKLALPVRRALADNGAVILSGLLADQVPLVRAAYATVGLRLVRTLTLEGWASLLLSPRPTLFS